MFNLILLRQQFNLIFAQTFDPHLGVNGKALFFQLGTSWLERFFDQDANACDGSMCFTDQADSAGGSFAVCQKIVNNQHMVMLAD